MPPESAKYLKDMLDAIVSIEQAVQNKTYADYANEKLLRDAVQWNFCVLGEALVQLENKHHALAQSISDRRNIIGLRNQLIHGYAVIKNSIIWNIITDHLPDLRAQLEKLLAG